MPDSIGSMTQYAGNIQVQRLAQDVQKTLVPKLFPEPVQQTSGKDSASFSSEALSRLQSEEAAAAAVTQPTEAL
jgi:hypothetical protein